MLQELYDYGIKHELALPHGFVKRTFKAFIALDSNGSFIGLEMSDKQPVVAPDIGSLAVGSKSCNVLIEKRSLILNEPETETAADGSQTVVKDYSRKHQFFKEVLLDGMRLCPSFRACYMALEDVDTLQAIREACSAAKIKAGDRLTFTVDGKSILDEPALIEWWQAFLGKLKPEDAKKTRQVRCLISGELISNPMERIPMVQGLSQVGGHGSGDSLACFDKPAFSSYGLHKALNSPMSEETFSVIRQSLNELIARAPRVGGMKFLHWYQDAVAEENDILMPQFRNDDTDDEEDEGEEAVEPVYEEASENTASALVRSSYNGQDHPVLDTTYYILMLSAYPSRVMIRRYETGSYEKLTACLNQWEQDLSLATLNGVSLATQKSLNVRLTRLLHRQKRDKNIWDRVDKELAGLSANILQAILSGGPLPDTVAARALAYIRSDMVDADSSSSAKKKNSVPDKLACQWLKVWILRKERYENKEETIMPFVNENHPCPAYHCGRMMAVYGDIQSKAYHGKVNATVVQRFYAACQTSPRVVLGRLEQMSHHHLEKIENPNVAARYNQMLNDISVAIGSVVPATLSLEEQAYFVLGYRQQCAEMNRLTAEAIAAAKAKKTAAAAETPCV